MTEALIITGIVTWTIGGIAVVLIVALIAWALFLSFCQAVRVVWLGRHREDRNTLRGFLRLWWWLSTNGGKLTVHGHYVPIEFWRPLDYGVDEGVEP